jgi:predicted ABC-type transport system involved in lysophospholipase L1 biosynthesis ATPase subunit
VETTLESDNLVVATNLSRVIGSGATAVRILDDVSLRVPRLSLFAINGPSGSGKSPPRRCHAGRGRPARRG